MKHLLELSNNPYNAVDFDKIRAENFIPALKEAIQLADEEILKYKKITEIDFDSCILKLEEVSEKVDYIATIFYALYAANATKEIQEISEEVSSLLTKFSNNITLDSEVFEKVKKCYEVKGELSLTSEQEKVLESYYLDFTRNGALLNEEDKTILRDIDEKLSTLNLKFSKNVLDATNAFELHIQDEKQLQGLPESSVEAAKELANSKNKEGWIFTLQYPSYIPFITYCDDPELREKMARAAGEKAFGGEFDNQKNIIEIVSLKEKRAHLLGFENHADFVLQKRMAQSPHKVFSFLDDLLEKALPAAQKEKKRIEDMAGKPLDRWDVTYYSEKLKKKELDLDEEMLRPYFKLENVVKGVFDVAHKLYGIKFQQIDVPVYHPEVKAYKVLDEKDEYVGLFYTDFFPRETKRGGAWMTELFGQGHFQGEVRRPHISIVCNFTKPTASKPSLLTFNEVTTLFHEFGHALHGLLTQCQYRKLSGTSVFWDFVELPSQIMENWVQEKDCLDLFAVHYETGEKMPVELIEKIKKSGKFLQGLATIRQLSFGLVDMAWHTSKANEINDVVKFEREHMSKADVFSPIEGSCFSTAFSHIFAGGYSAGYYSYKWAEVLDADAFDFFKQKGIFNKEVANKFKTFILEKGGTEHPMELYKKFRGSEPKVEALLKRAGLS